MDVVIAKLRFSADATFCHFFQRLREVASWYLADGELPNIQYGGTGDSSTFINDQSFHRGITGTLMRSVWVTPIDTRIIVHD